MNELAVKRSQEISAFSKDEPITAYFRQLIAEKTGIVIAPDTPKPVIRSMICGFEELMKRAAASGEMVDENPNYVINHHFTDGVYAREMHIPAGHVVVGKIHRHEHLNFVSKGRATVITEEGGMQQVKAGDTLISPAGVKRLLITHEDTVWTVVHATSERDLEKIEESVIAKTYADMGWEMPVPLIEHKDA